MDNGVMADTMIEQRFDHGLWGMDSASSSQVAVLRVICLSRICMATGASMVPSAAWVIRARGACGALAGHRSAIIVASSFVLCRAGEEVARLMTLGLARETLQVTFVDNAVSHVLRQQCARPHATSHRACPHPYLPVL